MPVSFLELRRQPAAAPTTMPRIALKNTDGINSTMVHFIL
ncbi:MAG: hypothetical protein A4E45_00879 [Methanosaeta sp. PtaB.Bin039]|nr:MAG: hypothetical protein A4E45_00879 [Methanosaeta sp. PtaB.Bin039]